MGADTDAAAILGAIEHDLGLGAVGVALEPAADGGRDGGPVPEALVSAAVTLTDVTVAVDDPAQGERALDAGASGVMACTPADPRLRAVAAARGRRLWLTGVSAPPGSGPAGERLILETTVASLPGLVHLIGGPGAPPAARLMACSLPGSGSVDDGVIEALVTLAVAGGATVLRCGGSFGSDGDVRRVRRCADVAAELLCRGVAMGDVDRDRRGLAS